MTLGLAATLRIATLAFSASCLAGCCGYLIPDCPSTQGALNSAGMALSALGNARAQAGGLIESSNTAFKPQVAQSFAPKYAAFQAASTVWQNDAAAVLRSQASFSNSRNVSELGAVSSTAKALADAVSAAAHDPQSYQATYAPLPPNAVIDAETANPPIVAAARSFAEDTATGTALMQAIAPSIIDQLSPQEREAIAIGIAGAESPSI